jgi:dynein heavy chain
VLLCTGFLSYSGPFNQEFRDKLITLWQKEMCERKIPYSQDLNLISMLVDTTTVRYILLHGMTKKNMLNLKNNQSNKLTTI